MRFKEFFNVFLEDMDRDSSDEEYFHAIELGDTNKLQQLVNARAKSNGYNSPKVYHGTSAKFDIFDKSRIGEANGRSEGAGFYFTTDKDVADGYGQGGESVISAYLHITKLLDYNAKPFNLSQIKKLLKQVAITESKYESSDIKDGFLSNFDDTYSNSIDSIINTASKFFIRESTALDQIGSIVGAGVAPVIVNEALTLSLGYDTFFSKGFSGSNENGGDIYVATKPSQIKSADPITYDNGNIIPLSQRFDSSKDSIFY